MPDHDAEDLKLVTLARSARARNGASEGAAVRDGTGRTYVATPVLLQGLTLTAVQAAIAAAVSSGAGALEAVALVGPTDASAADRALAAELAAQGARFLVADAAGAVTASDPL